MSEYLEYKYGIRQLSRPGRLVKALGHHMMQPNDMPDMQCTMLVKKPTRRFVCLC